MNMRGGGCRICPYTLLRFISIPAASMSYLPMSYLPYALLRLISIPAANSVRKQPSNVISFVP